MSARRRRDKMPKRMFRRERVSPPPLPPGTKAVYPGPGHEKMSEVLEDFVSPYRDLAPDLEGYRILLNMGILAWNVAMEPDERRQEIIDDVLGEALTDAGPAERKSANELVWTLIRRKLEHFADNRRLIYSFELTDRGDDFYLTVASTI